MFHVLKAGGRRCVDERCGSESFCLRREGLLLFSFTLSRASNGSGLPTDKQKSKQDAAAAQIQRDLSEAHTPSSVLDTRPQAICTHQANAKRATQKARREHCFDAIAADSTSFKEAFFNTRSFSFT
jgi:hypothetical protein